MKVSILSMQRIINYGSFLQAYALKRNLEKLGHDVSFIDIKKGEYCEESNLTTESYFKKIFKYIFTKNMFKKISFKKSADDLSILLKQNQKDILGLTDEFQNVQDDCDAVVIGSDEVFNCAPKCSWGVSTQLFGNIDVPIVISYAASCGYTVYDDVPEFCREGINKALNNLKAISVRDENTKNFVYKMSNIQANMNFDPVLVYDFNDEVLEAEKNLELPKNYMIVYAYANRFNDKEEVKQIMSYAKKNGLKMLCVGARQDWCDEFPVWTPFEVLAAFKNANCIVTDTFHGTIMAAKFNKRFATFIRKSNANKLEDLLNKLGVIDHKVTNLNDFEKIISLDSDFSYFNNKIIEETKRTIDYLGQNLK